ncbi:putative disease resistance RPP13-like protein 1 [Ziziphus jujuba]|uniref:Disease resistance RPP13-like protein 1 n=1 Tax=Ziziphus jujuba TaxID=326968 RepID=A0ABM3ZYC1_ZIZJJ|nr:putative disease resistance RPP13-like protein 1 [Ziziphus jujuba]
MAVELVGGAILFAGLEVVFNRLLSAGVVDYLKGQRLSDELISNLKRVALAINGWLSELEDASYDADDLLDKIATHALKSKVEGAGSTKTKTSKLLSSALSIGARRLYNTRDMKNKLEEIFKSKKPRPRSQTTSLVEESEVFGRDGVKNAIINLFLVKDEGGKEVYVIPIVGMGGIGKTTLAKLVYNDDKVKNHFTLKAWVYVYEEFDICKVTKSILTAITSSNSYDHWANNLDLLQSRLKEELVGKKFLIILDDVWTQNYDDWKAMSLPFNHRAQRSKIIITTRNEGPVDMTVNIPTRFQLKSLNEEDCWQMFAKHAFDNIRDSSVRQNLEPTDKEIGRKCQGLPLASKTNGGLLRFKEDVGEWEKILRSEI